MSRKQTTLNTVAGSLRSYSSHWIALPNLNTRGSAYSYGNLLCHVLLIPMGGLSLFEQKQRSGLEKKLDQVMYASYIDLYTHQTHICGVTKSNTMC